MRPTPEHPIVHNFFSFLHVDAKGSLSYGAEEETILRLHCASVSKFPEFSMLFFDLIVAAYFLHSTGKANCAVQTLLDIARTHCFDAMSIVSKTRGVQPEIKKETKPCLLSCKTYLEGTSP